MTATQKRLKNTLKNRIWREANRQKCRSAANKYRREHPDRTHAYRLKVRYGISQTEYLTILERQGRVCAICKNPETALHNYYKNKQKLAVDHCHKTGKVRGLLCQDCNRGLGKFHEDPTRLMNAIEYINATKNLLAEASRL